MVSVRTSKADIGWLLVSAVLLPVTVCVWVWVFSVGDACVGCMWVMRCRMYWTVVLPICQNGRPQSRLDEGTCVGRVYVSLVRTNED